MTPDMSHYWEGEREWCEDNKWDEKKCACCAVRWQRLFGRLLTLPSVIWSKLCTQAMFR